MQRGSIGSQKLLPSGGVGGGLGVGELLLGVIREGEGEGDEKAIDGELLAGDEFGFESRDDDGLAILVGEFEGAGFVAVGVAENQSQIFAGGPILEGHGIGGGLERAGVSK